jgi:hypothetical protein
LDCYVYLRDSATLSHAAAADLIDCCCCCCCHRYRMTTLTAMVTLR